MKQILIVEDDSFLNKMFDFCPKRQNRSRSYPPAGI